MITGRIDDFEKYVAINPDFKEAFEFMHRCLCEDNPRIDTECVKGSVSKKETSSAYENEEILKLEAHKKYIDIHFIIDGEERFGYAHIDRLSLIQEYNEEKDFMLLKGKADILLLKKGDFIITFPEDAHAPSLKSEGYDTVKRTVIKIQI